MKNVVVIGGTGGIGEAVVRKFVDKGCRVIFSYCHGQKKAQELIDCFAENENRPQAFYLNTVETESVKRFAEYVETQFESVDSLLYCSGIINDSSFLTMSPEVFEQVIQTNLYGCFYIIKELFTDMNFTDGASIVSVSSTGGIRPNAGQANYSASKAGIIAMMESIAREYAKKNIRVNSVAPGFIRTDMVDLTNSKIQQSISEIPMKRLGEPEEVANAVYFLASEEASYITAQTLIVDGGRI